jgi:hypothetical protein
MISKKEVEVHGERPQVEEGMVQEEDQHHQT